MNVEFQKVDMLPRLAWCACIDRRNRTIGVLHGPQVEVGDGFFCEGAWSGEFGAGDFERNQFMGSGGKVIRGGLLIAAPNHTVERLYVLRQGDVMYVSNSCAFVFAQAKEEPDPNYLLYTPRIASIIRGLDAYARSIPTRSGNRVYMYCHCNLRVGVNHEVEEEPKPPVREFLNFADYKSFLEEEVSAIVRNANDPARMVTYRPLATISSGYDSPAAAVFARNVGCRDAVTFPRARPGTIAEDDDSGAVIGERLGLKVQSYERLGYRDQPGFPEAEGGISEFLSLRDVLQGRLLFAGFNGDTIWDRCSDRVSRYIRRTALSGDDLAELRLRLGFVLLPVAYLGCTSHPSIHRISNSSEMRPWSIGSEYDKPIPRRLLEEAGVERGSFAAAKKAVAIVAREEGFEQTMTPESFADLKRFVRRHRSLRLAAKLRWYRGVYYLARANRAVNRKLAALASRIMGKRIWLSMLVPADLERLGQSGPYALLFHWSIDKLMPRYRVQSALAAAGGQLLELPEATLASPE
jgi:hypothetical protein